MRDIDSINQYTNVIFCSTLDIPISSSATCGEVIMLIKKELALVKCVNGFGLFESCGNVQKYLEEKVAQPSFLFHFSDYLRSTSLPTFCPSGRNTRRMASTPRGASGN